MEKIVYEKEEYKGYNCIVYYDPDPMSPDDWDTLGTIYSNHRDYNPQNHRIDEILVEDDDGNRHIDPDYIYVNIYAYIHGGVALSCSRSGQFADRWDSGLFGVMAVEKSKAVKEFGDLSVPENMERVLKCLEGEVECWDMYYQGIIFGFVVEDQDEDTYDSCWGFYGYDGAKEAMLEAKSYVDFYIKKAEEKRNNNLEKIKDNIMMLVGNTFISDSDVYRVVREKMFGTPVIEMAEVQKGRVRDEFYNHVNLTAIPDEVLEDMAKLIV